MSGCVETVALYEVDLPEEMVSELYEKFAFINTMQMGVEGAERRGEEENHGAEYFSIFMSTIARRTMAPGAL